MKRIAMTVGIDRYHRNSQLTELKYAMKDATRFHGLLNKLDFDETLTLFSERATTAAITDMLSSKVSPALKKGDLFVFYFSGHGHDWVRGGKSSQCILPWNTTVDGLSNLTAHYVIQVRDICAMAERKGAICLILLDSCRNKLKAGEKGAGEEPNRYARRDLQLLIEKAESVSAPLCILTSCQPEHPAYENGELEAGIFTHALLEVWERAYRDRRSVEVSDSMFESLQTTMRRLQKELSPPPSPIQLPWAQRTMGRIELKAGSGPSPAATVTDHRKLSDEIRRFVENRHGHWTRLELLESVTGWQNRGLLGSLRCEEVIRQINKEKAQWESDISSRWVSEASNQGILLPERLEPVLGAGLAPLNGLAPGSSLAQLHQRHYAEQNSLPLEVRLPSSRIPFRLIPPDPDQGVEKPFYLSMYPLSEALAASLSSEDPDETSDEESIAIPASHLLPDHLPDLLQALRKREQCPPGILTPVNEAEWKLACRAGTQTLRYTGDETADMLRAGWCFENTRGTTCPDLSTLSPNAFGVYGMLGGVWEWCSQDENSWAARGGSFRESARECRWDNRDTFPRLAYTNQHGVRLVLRIAPIHSSTAL